MIFDSVTDEEDLKFKKKEERLFFIDKFDGFLFDFEAERLAIDIFEELVKCSVSIWFLFPRFFV